MGGGVKPDTHEYVDLGLPSGTLWATCNIGANSPEEAGLYFAWGETSGYTAEQVGTDKYFIWEDYTDESGVTHHNDYKYGRFVEIDPNYGMQKYNYTSKLFELEPEDDAATANWGSDWKMPTKTDFEELIANTTSAFTQVDGVNGVLFTSNANSNTLFFPALGEAGYGKVEYVGTNVMYWSSSLNEAYGECYMAFSLCFGESVLEGNQRMYGLSVRPVRSNN